MVDGLRNSLAAMRFFTASLSARRPFGVDALGSAAAT